MILNMGKYPSLKNCYTHLLKSAIQRLAGQVHHCKLQITHTHTKREKSPKQTNKKNKEYKQNKKKSLKKLVCWGMDPKR